MPEIKEHQFRYKLPQNFRDTRGGSKEKLYKRYNWESVRVPSWAEPLIEVENIAI